MTAWPKLVRAACVLALSAALWNTPASAQDAVKDLLGKAQSESETQAVEDLIRKLQGTRPAAAVKAPAPPAPQERPPSVIEARPAPATAPTAPATAPDVPIETAAPKVPEAPVTAPVTETAPRAPDTAGTPAVAAAARAVESADQRRLPSVDLEVYFDLASAAITPQATSDLSPLGRALADPRLADGVFLIAGHTDAQGPARYNLRLSQKRAESVRQHLISTFNIAPERLIAQGFGEERLKNPRNPAAAENRRVQIVNMAEQASR